MYTHTFWRRRVSLPFDILSEKLLSAYSTAEARKWQCALNSCYRLHSGTALKIACLTFAWQWHLWHRGANPFRNVGGGGTWFYMTWFYMTWFYMTWFNFCKTGLFWEAEKIVAFRVVPPPPTPSDRGHRLRAEFGMNINHDLFIYLFISNIYTG